MRRVMGHLPAPRQSFLSHLPQAKSQLGEGKNRVFRLLEFIPYDSTVMGTEDCNPQFAHIRSYCSGHGARVHAVPDSKVEEVYNH